MNATGEKISQIKLHWKFYFSHFESTMKKAGGRKSSIKEDPNVPKYVGPRIKEGELVFGVAQICASFNDTFVVCFFFWVTKVKVS
jgi:hypothetical protein